MENIERETEQLEPTQALSPDSAPAFASGDDGTRPLPAERDLTYGEKTHKFIFNTLINLWGTLAISGLFVFWVKHSNKPLPKTFFGGKLPSEFHASVRDIFAKSPIVKIFPDNARAKVGEIMADALSINLPGTLTILPSAWLGEKFKTQIVEGLDRSHYGDNAEDNPHIAARHRAIETEIKPTLLGATVARLCSMTASVMTGYAIGAPENFINRFGKNNKLLSKFPGIDAWAGKAGEATGHTIAEGAPKFDNWINRQFRKGGISWEPGSYKGGEYNRSLQDWSKWTSLDVMYTLVTSSTIHPFIKLIRGLPGMSYQEKPHALPTPITHNSIPASTIATIPETSLSSSKTDTDTPRIHVSDVSNHARISERTEPQVTT